MKSALILSAILFILPGQKSLAQGTEGGNRDTIIIDHDEIQRSVDEGMKELQQSMIQLEKGLRSLEEGLRNLEMNVPQPQDGIKDTTIKGKNSTIKISDDGICIKLNNDEKKDGKDEGDEHEQKEEKKRDDIETDWFLMDLGINTITSDGNIGVPEGYEYLELNYGGSRNFTLHLFSQGVNIANHNLFLRYGVAFDFLNFRFQENITLLPNSSDPDSFHVMNGESFSKNKLAAQYVTIPVMFQFETKPFDRGKSFRLGAGGYAGLLINSYAKQKTDDGRKVKVRDDFNLNKVRYGVRGEIGFSKITLYANYDMSPLFKFKENPALPVQPYNDMNVLAMGIVLNGFDWK